jgi:hypothetical protein
VDALLAFGVGRRFTSGSWDFVPLFTTIALLLIARMWIRLRVSLPIVGASLVGGLLLSDAMQRWGFALIAVTTALASWVTATIVRGQRTQRHPDPPV